MNSDDRLDALSRWMAHHIAELIKSAEASADPKTRRERKAEAFAAITKLWTHRSQYESRVNPVFDLKPVLRVIRTLTPDNDSWIPRHFGHGGSAGAVYDIFRRLMIWAIIQKAAIAGDIPSAIKRAKKTAKFQTASEQEIVAGLELWTGEIKQGQRSSAANGATGVDGGSALKDFLARGPLLIAEARKALDTMEEELSRVVATGAVAGKRKK